MALEVTTGQFAVPGAGDTTLSATDPKAILCWTSGRTANGGGSDHMRFCQGWGTYRGSVVQQGCTLIASEDNIGTADSYCGGGNGALLRLTNGTTNAIVMDSDLVSMSSSSVVISHGTRLTGALVNYMIIGGSDLLDALATTLTTQATPATQDVTVASGFGQPSVVFFMLSWDGGFDNTINATLGSEMCMGFGIKEGSTNGRALRVLAQDAAATQASGQIIYNNTVSLTGGSQTVTDRCTFRLSASSAWPTDGFELTYTSQIDSGFPVPYLALKFSSNVTVTHGQGSMRTTTGDTDHAVGTSTPKGFLIYHTRQLTASSHDVTTTDCMLFGVGAVDGSGNEVWTGASDDDGQGTASVCGTYTTNTKALQNWLPSTNVLDTEADCTIAGSNFRLTFTDAAPSAFLYEWVAFGITGAPPPPSNKMAMVI